MDNQDIDNPPDDDEISLIDLFAVLWRRRIMILAITLAAMAGVVVFAVISLDLNRIQMELEALRQVYIQLKVQNETSDGLHGVVRLLPGLFQAPRRAASADDFSVTLTDAR